MTDLAEARCSRKPRTLSCIVALLTLATLSFATVVQSAPPGGKKGGGGGTLPGPCNYDGIFT
jgi:hypothetical protein